jgi:hypothetical protein
MTRWDAEASGVDGEGAPMKDRKRLRPSFDRIGGGYPTVDLHVADVPYGSRAHTRVKVEAPTSGWYASAVLSSWVATAVLLLAWIARPTGDVGSSLLMSFAAAYVAILARPDPHRLITRLLSKLRSLATVVALLSFAAAALVALADQTTAHRWLGPLFAASVATTSLISLSWLSAVWRKLSDDPQESPWVQRRPRQSRLPEEDPHERIARIVEGADYPYDAAFIEFEFDRPAIRVDSCEGARSNLVWNRGFSQAFDSRLLRTSHTAVPDRRASDTRTGPA